MKNVIISLFKYLAKSKHGRAVAFVLACATLGPGQILYFLSKAMRWAAYKMMFCNGSARNEVKDFWSIHYTNLRDIL